MIRLSPGLFNRQLGVMGQSMVWRKAMLCPCRDKHSGGAREDCPVCSGRGVSWGRGVPSKAGVVGAKAAKKQAEFGQWEDGDVALSVGSDTPMWLAGEKDRFRFLDGEMPFSVVLRHNGAARIDFVPVRFERCFWLRGDEDAYREASLPRWDAATGSLSWPAGSVPPDAGDHFTLTGWKRPEYFLFGTVPVSRQHFNGLPLPRLFHCKKIDLIDR